MRVLVAGWFSFEGGHATAGDLLALDLLCEWLASAGFPYDVATAQPFQGGIDLARADPGAYTDAVFVCGPFERKPYEAQFLGRFAACRVIGINLTMITPLHEWNPFDVLIERDSSVAAHPDIVFSSQRPHVPVVGICLVEPYPGAIDGVANAAIERLVASREMATVSIDTRLDVNATRLRTPSEIESLLARMDVVITTRLHGMVLSLKNGVPALAIDPEAGGAKIVRQGETIGWPIVFAADTVTDAALQAAFDYCLTDAARVAAAACAAHAAARITHVRETLIDALRSEREPGKIEERTAFAAAVLGPDPPPRGRGLARFWPGRTAS